MRSVSFLSLSRPWRKGEWMSTDWGERGKGRTLRSPSPIPNPPSSRLLTCQAEFCISLNFLRVSSSLEETSRAEMETSWKLISRSIKVLLRIWSLMYSLGKGSRVEGNVNGNDDTAFEQSLSFFSGFPSNKQTTTRPSSVPIRPTLHPLRHVTPSKEQVSRTHNPNLTPTLSINPQASCRQASTLTSLNSFRFPSLFAEACVRTRAIASEGE